MHRHRTQAPKSPRARAFARMRAWAGVCANGAKIAGKRLLRRCHILSQNRNMNSEYGADDCWTFAFGNIPRPEILKAESEDIAYTRALRKYGSNEGICVAIEAEMPNYRRLVEGETQAVGDIIIGVTAEHPFMIAKIDDSFLPIQRTKHGYAVAHFISVIGVWRRVS